MSSILHASKSLTTLGLKQSTYRVLSLTPQTSCRAFTAFSAQSIQQHVVAPQPLHPELEAGAHSVQVEEPALDSVTSKPPTNSLLKSDSHDYFTSAAWPHPIYTKDQMEAVGVSHRAATTMSDKVAFATIEVLRSCFDFATGYTHPKPGHEKEAAMTADQWMMRIVFLESIAGVPGMVGGMVRHLHSLRCLRRDRAWIETLLEEAYNERMHLLTAMKIYKPGRFMRLMLLGGQGVFFNLFFAAYLVSPRTCHRFVGYLEEEAVITYTRCLSDLRNGLIPDLAKQEVPDIAKQYWKMSDDSTMTDLFLYIRADEAKHREVNHTFGNLDQKSDRNPFAMKIDNGKPQPSKGLDSYEPVGWEKKDIAA
ncbi:alternative oxidase-domain-containing protein [Lipomyces oligophaga]|uniref:alternative oxidase-domain-containing protein n=1 Tax=Lipomyces oligophaga TaxID=45792 RepID=UPI0034CE83E8